MTFRKKLLALPSAITGILHAFLAKQEQEMREAIPTAAFAGMMVAYVMVAYVIDVLLVPVPSVTFRHMRKPQTSGRSA